MRINDFFVIKELLSIAIERSYIAYSLNEMPVSAIGIDYSNSIVYSHNKKNIHAEHFLLNCHTWIVTLEPCISCTHLAILNNVKNIFFAYYSDKGACGTFINLPLILKAKINIYGGLYKNRCNIIRSFFDKQ